MGSWLSIFCLFKNQMRRFSSLQTPELKSKQHIRRQRELLTLFVAVTDRLVSMERTLKDNFSESATYTLADLEEKARQGAAFLSNISQLLHFISKDVDLQRIFHVRWL